MEISNMLFGAQKSSMLQSEHIATFNAVLLSNWNVTEKRKNINLVFHLYGFDCTLQILNMPKHIRK